MFLWFYAFILKSISAVIIYLSGPEFLLFSFLKCCNMCGSQEKWQSRSRSCRFSAFFCVIVSRKFIEHKLLCSTPVDLEVEELIHFADSFENCKISFGVVKLSDITSIHLCSLPAHIRREINQNWVFSIAVPNWLFS